MGLCKATQAGPGGALCLQVKQVGQAVLTAAAATCLPATVGSVVQ